MGNRTCKKRKRAEMMVYPNNDIIIYSAILSATYLHEQISSCFCRKDCRKDHRKYMQSAVSSPKVNLFLPLGGKIIFLPCKKPFLRAQLCRQRRMIPLVAVCYMLYGVTL